MPWPRMRSTSRRSRTRRQIRTSICERTAPEPMAFCVGRWVAASRVTATARPRRAMESACTVATGASSASSAYSSITTISAGAVGVGVHSRGAVGGQLPGAGFEDGDGVGEQRGCLGRGGGEPVEAGRPRAQLHAALEVDAPEHDVGAGDELGEDDVEDAALAGAGDAAEQAVPVRSRSSDGLGVLEQAERDRVGDAACASRSAVRVGDRRGRAGRWSRTRMMAWSARSGSGSTRTAPGRVPSPDSSAGVALIRSVAVCRAAGRSGRASPSGRRRRT